MRIFYSILNSASNLFKIMLNFEANETRHPEIIFLNKFLTFFNQKLFLYCRHQICGYLVQVLYL